jgi:Interferon-related developmental regulator (IFRD)
MCWQRTKPAQVEGVQDSVTFKQVQESAALSACRRDTLASMFLNSLRRGGALEAALAARCLGLEAVTLGAGDECEQ